MKVLDFKNEDGFWAAFFVIFLVTLGLVAVGGAVLMQAEGINLGNQVVMMQMDYSMDGAVQYGLRAVEQNDFTSGTLTIGSITMSLDTLQNADGTVELAIIAAAGDRQKSTNLTFTTSSGLADYALVTTKTASGITFLDEDGNTSNDVRLENADSMVMIDETALIDLSDSQGNSKPGDFSATNNYPGAGFFQPDGTPRVTYINGELTVPSGITVFGIFFVTGQVWVETNATVNGVIYMPNNVDLDMERGFFSNSNINGGVVTNGAVTGSGGGWGERRLRHRSDFMTVFSAFETASTIPVKMNIQSWTRY